MVWTERFIWLFLVLILAGSLLWMRSDMQELSGWVDAQNEQLLEIDTLLDLAESRANALKSESDYASGIEIPDWEIRILRGRGLENPIHDIKSDLMSKPELIPYEGVLGGTMGFYSEDEILILPGGWVYAIFEDGHINGAVILTYTVDEGVITWTPINHSQF